MTGGVLLPTPLAPSSTRPFGLLLTTLAPAPRLPSAAIAAGQRYLDVANQINRDLFSVWTHAAEGSLQTTFEAQNAALANSQTMLDTSAELGKDALSRWVDVVRQAQATSLKTFRSSTKLVCSVTHE